MLKVEWRYQVAGRHLSLLSCAAVLWTGVTDLSLTGQGYAAMVSVLDEVVANLTATLRTTLLWDNTLLVRSHLAFCPRDSCSAAPSTTHVL
eukprot:COSAG02_NODE_1800_length_10896_cov_4.915162_6_plen_91_part_00